MAGTPAQKGYNAAGNNDSSRQTVALLSGWPTPTQQDQVGSGAMYVKTATHNPGVTLTDAAKMAVPARLTASGELLTGSDAAMESGGRLDPAHSLWLQLGPYATAWARCAERVTLSTLRKPKRSSEP